MSDLVLLHLLITSLSFSAESTDIFDLGKSHFPFAFKLTYSDNFGLDFPILYHSQSHGSCGCLSEKEKGTRE